MWALRSFQRNCLKSLSYLTNRTHLLRESPTTNVSNAIQSKVASLSYPIPFLLLGSATGTRQMSTMKGRSMRSKVEKRMRKETGKTLREIRRAKKLRKKLMTEEERLIYNLRRAKKKVALLLQKLKKYELPELPAPRHDPELLTAEQLQAYKKIGFRNRNYCEVGVRGVFGGVVQNMHMHWKFHETVQVYCDNFPKEKIKEMATMLARLSGGIVVNIHNVKTIIMFRGRNYRQPKNLIPVNTLTKRKALFKARFEQALESQKLNIKKIEQQLRRKGVNPEDPIAMASIQRVAATFFRAIDEKQGTPYVFKGEKPTTAVMDDGPEEQPELQPEDSDQEELDHFIKEIEDAADEEWAAEEAAEKEESSRIRYWSKDDKGMQGRSSNWNESEYRSRRDWNGHESRSRQRTTDVRRWKSDDENLNSDVEEWNDDEMIDVVGDIDSDDDSDYETRQRQIQRQKGHKDAQERTFKTIDIRRSRGMNNKIDNESDLSEDSADGIWESGEEEELGPGKTNDSHYNYLSSSDDDSDRGSTDNVRRVEFKKKKIDESWDSD